jgi:glycosyltransferase involved in cell wall biosynthesis
VKLVTTIGQLTPQKGMPEFITAVQQVSKWNPDCRFLIAGEGTPSFVRQLEEKITACGLQNYIYMLGFRTDIVNILNASDVFVLASRPCVEGLPRVVIEAMSCARPVVGTHVQGINEAVQNHITGILVPPNNPSQLAGAIIHLLANPDKATLMGNAARKRAENVFSIASNISKIQRVYEDVAPLRRGEFS